jgi:hypothetical protein
MRDKLSRSSRACHSNASERKRPCRRIAGSEASEFIRVHKAYPRLIKFKSQRQTPRRRKGQLWPARSPRMRRSMSPKRFGERPPSAVGIQAATDTGMASAQTGWLPSHCMVWSYLVFVCWKHKFLDSGSEAKVLVESDRLTVSAENANTPCRDTFLIHP